MSREGCPRWRFQDCAHRTPKRYSWSLCVLLALAVYGSANDYLSVTTAVFSTCGMGIFVFSLAAILSMPKQMITVYLGVILKQESEGTPSS